MKVVTTILTAEVVTTDRLGMAAVAAGAHAALARVEGEADTINMITTTTWAGEMEVPPSGPLEEVEDVGEAVEGSTIVGVEEIGGGEEEVEGVMIIIITTIRQDSILNQIGMEGVEEVVGDIMGGDTTINFHRIDLLWGELVVLSQKTNQY